MVITDEFKFPRPPRIEPGVRDRGVDRIDGIIPVLPVKRYWRKWRKNKDRHHLKGVDDSLPDGAEKTLQILVDKVNENLQKHQVPIHLGLVRVHNGYEIDIYDCSDNRVCKIIREDAVHLEDLSTLFRNLQEESGILIDTVF
ncbi:MAG: hypothetical protein U9R66_07595 [Thermodesulfobacteriota bacterium]|nr:hypothetical protein [Thermodesulfobacteriota bacterium]